MIRNSPEHIYAVRLIDLRFNQMIDDAKEQFICTKKGDPDVDPAFQAIRRKIEADRAEEWRYLLMELDENEPSSLIL